MVETVIAVATAVQAAVVVVAAVIAWGQVREARALRIDQAQPYVIVYLKETAASRHLVDLVIENVGRTAARDVRISITPPPKSALDQGDDSDRFARWGALRDGIDTLAPRQRLSSLFDGLIQRFPSDLPRKYDVTVRFRDDRGDRPHEYHYTLDFDTYFGAQFVAEKGIHDAARALEEILKRVTAWTANLDGVRVYNVDSDVYDRRVQEAIEDHRSSPSGDVE
jgi:hypothetical protein